LTWNLISTHVWTLFWGTYLSATGVSKDSVYMLVSNDQSSHQIGVGNGGLYTNADQLNLIDVVIDDLSSNTVRVDVEQMLSIGEYVYIIAKPVGSPAVRFPQTNKNKNKKNKAKKTNNFFLFSIWN